MQLFIHIILTLWGFRLVLGEEHGICSVEQKGEGQLETRVNSARYNCCKVRKRKVLFDHAGCVDDFICTMLLQLSPNIDLLGITITPADCIPEDATQNTLKVLNAFGNHHIPVAQGSIGGLHPFPLKFREQAYFVQHLPDLINVQNQNDSQLVQIPAHEFIINTLEQQEDKSVTVLMVSPATNLVHALKQCPKCADKIEEVVWMAGAINVKGNVYDTYHFEHIAEWNAYWDPWASQQLSRMGLNITLFPLDVTDKVPVTVDFLQQFAKSKDKDLSRLAGSIYSAVVGGMQGYSLPYYMWNSLATAYLLVDNLVEMEMMEIDFSVDSNIEGKSYQAEGSKQWMQVAVDTDANKFQQFILSQFNRNFS
eukprot:TRINITY_DN4567_c0_g1_i1.p1 TRINITY_DN4567_c0_g1~~TRINITY_DN4567_c0_g1_i1.p1  ORF type:complete len:386 (+),score=35.09 TRINITY_DN4567_c0_g1_i1:61-1158(+)